MKPMEKLPKQHTTRDLGEASALISRDCPLSSLQWKDDTAFFVFDDPRAVALSHDYFYGELSINARTYYDNLRMLKRRLYTDTKGGKYVHSSR